MNGSRRAKTFRQAAFASSGNGSSVHVMAEMFASAVGVPIVHVHGGEETEGAFDNALRHGGRGSARQAEELTPFDPDLFRRRYEIVFVHDRFPYR